MYVASTPPVIPASCGQQLYGLGMFDSGLDWTQWGWQEWLTAGIGLYAVLSMASATSRGARTVRRKLRRSTA